MCDILIFDKKSGIKKGEREREARRVSWVYFQIFFPSDSDLFS